jgi:tetratricopeptide (TPR) repeat protein
MKLRRVCVALLAAVLCAVPIQISGAELSKISGVVRDANDAPIEGALIVATIESSDSLQTRSGQAGDYTFTGLQTGEYNVSASLRGYESAAPQKVKILAIGSVARADFKLTKVISGNDSNRGDAKTPPKFEAAGVRGLIDPGGYSASGGAVAATGVIKGMADIRRVDEDAPFLPAKVWPCGLEPELRVAVESAPSSADANLKLGEFYLAHDEAAQAIPFLERARKENDGDSDTSKTLVVAFLKNRQFDSAREVLDRLIQNHDDAESHSLLARAQEGSGRFKQAAEQYQIADGEVPSEENLFGTGYELILAGLPQDSARAFQDGLKRYPNSVKLLIGLGTAEFLRGNTSQGILHFLRAADLAPSDPRPYAFLASASGVQAAETEKQVRESFKRFLDLEPNSAEANYYYAMSLRNGVAPETGRVESDKIDALLKRAVQIKPDFASAHFQLGSLYSDREDYAGAVREYETTLRLQPTLKEAHYRLARAYKNSGQTELAAQQMRLFQQERNQGTTRSGETPVSIEQFVSVIASTQDQEKSRLSCPAVQPN